MQQSHTVKVDLEGDFRRLQAVFNKEDGLAVQF